MTRVLKLAILFAALFLLAAGAGCSHVIHAYDGDERPDAEVAKVFNTDEIRLVSIDERPIDDFVSAFRREHEPGKHVFHLLPGEHRIAVKYYRTLGDTAYETRWQESVNNVTLRHRFEPGRSYSFMVATVTLPTDPRPAPGAPVPAGVWRPMLVDRDTFAVVARPEGDLAAGAPPPSYSAPSQSPYAPPPPMSQQPYAPPVSQASPAAPAPAPAPAPTGLVSGVCTITGVAQAQTKKLGLVTAAGREVLLVPRTPRALKWIDAELEHRKPGLKLNPFPPNTPDEAEDDDKVRKVLGYGDGQFIFERVPLGEYLVVFEGHEPEVFVTATVSVHPGQTRIDGLKLSPPTPANAKSK